jgi:Fe-S oxidoreductase
VISGIKEFLRGGTLSPAAALKTTACMGCYGCVDLSCPIGLDSLGINQMVYRAAELAKEKPFSAPLHEEHRKQLDLLTTPDELSRITTAVHTIGAKYAFFPGCNVYLQPDKVLNALDILDATGVPYSFIPGLEHCCGLARGTWGTPTGCRMPRSI